MPDLVTIITSKDIIFAPGYRLAPGMNAEIVFDWPWLRDGWIHLELVLRVTITSNEDNVIEAQVLAYFPRHVAKLIEMRR